MKEEEQSEGWNSMHNGPPDFAIGDQVFLKSDPWIVETITRVTTDMRGVHWYYTLTDTGKKRVIPLPERVIRKAC